MENQLPSGAEFLSLNHDERSLLTLEWMRTVIINQTNHLKHHEDKEREERKYFRSIKLIAISAIITACSSLIIGLILFGIKFFI